MHNFSNKQRVVDVFEYTMLDSGKEIIVLIHKTVSLQVDSAIVRPLSVGIEVYFEFFSPFGAFIVSNMFIKVSRNCRLIPQ